MCRGCGRSGGGPQHSGGSGSVIGIMFAVVLMIVILKSC